MSAEANGGVVISEDIARSVFETYNCMYGPVRHQKESFDKFMSHTLPHIIQENSDVVVRHPGSQLVSTFSFHNVRVPKPCVIEDSGFVEDVTPAEARLRGITYSSTIIVDVEQATRDSSSRDEADSHDKSWTRNNVCEGAVIARKFFTGVKLAQIPIMVGSNTCHLSDGVGRETECICDPGGYFIVNGVEKGFVGQEKLRVNYPFVFRSSTDGRRVITCEVRSCHEDKLRSTSTLYITASVSKTGCVCSLQVLIPFVKSPLSLTEAFCVLGVCGMDALRSFLVHPDDSPALAARVRSLLETMTETVEYGDVFNKVSSGTEGIKGTHVQHILTNEFMPHIGLDTSPISLRRKAWFLAMCVRRVLSAVIGEVEFSDRDRYSNKRVDTAGALLALLFRQLFRAFLKYTANQLSKHVSNPRVENIMNFVSHRKITSGLRYAFATGIWGIQKNSTTQTGVLQVMSRMTRVAPVSCLQRINTPLCREGKAPEPRQLHLSSWGYVCAAETPEGVSCGLMKSLCCMTHIRTGVRTDVVLACLASAGIPERLRRAFDGGLPHGSEEESRRLPVFINGQCLGSVLDASEAAELTQELRVLRRRAALPTDASIAYEEQTRCVQISTDRGGMCRPLLVAENIHLLAEIAARLSGPLLRYYLWSALMANGVIEYVTKDEEDCIVVAMRSEDLRPGVHTHCEIHPTVINGLCAAQIPFSDHNQSPRNSYQSAMGKQAVGVYTSNFMQRMDTVAHVLNQPQRPLVSTWADEAMQAAQLPAGANAMVAIMCWTGYNQEDSLIINKTSLDTGMFDTAVYRTYKEETHPNSSDVQTLEFPDSEECGSMKINDYSKLQGASTPPVGTIVSDGDVIIGKTIASRATQNGQSAVKKRDHSVCVKHNEGGVVDRVYVRGDSTNRTVRVRTRQTRVPQVGDKLASRHGQKGVIGMVYHEKDIPFTPDGLRPDIIVNPHAIPSRMTIGMLVEMLLSKECLVTGNIGDGTPFRQGSVEQISDELERMGFRRDATETMHNAYSGEPMECRVFLAPAYYQRLKHMAADKIHARGRGPVQLLTRQPNEGRSRDGGLRFGEMERDCVLAHGCASTLKECLFEKSDPYSTVACTCCGIICEPRTAAAADSAKAAGGEVGDRCKGLGDHSNRGYCRRCDRSDTVRRVHLPYAMKLLLQELQALHILARIRFEEGTENDDEPRVRGVEPVSTFLD